MNPNRLVVLALPALLTATAVPASAETFQDWALLRVQDAVFGARLADFDAAKARQRSGAGLTHIVLYDMRADDRGAAEVVMPVSARPFACLRLYPKSGPLEPMAVRFSQNEDQADIGATRIMKTDSRVPPPPYGSNAEGPGLKSFRGGWDRQIRVTVNGTPPPFCAGLIALEQLSPAQQALADALREMNPTTYAQLAAAAPADRGPLLEAVAMQHRSHEVSIAPDEAGNLDLWGALHPVDRAALARLPADQQAALRQKLAAVNHADAARQVLGEVRKAVTAFLGSTGDPGAMAALSAASRRVASARLDPRTGAVTFDGAAPPDGEPVVAAAPHVHAHRTGPDPRVYTGDPGRLGVVTSPRVDPPPRPGVPGERESPGAGLLSGVGDLFKSPYVSAGAGALAGALLGFMVAGPFGAAVGAALGMPLGLMVAQFFGKGSNE